MDTPPLPKIDLNVARGSGVCVQSCLSLPERVAVGVDLVAPKTRQKVMALRAEISQF
jgi:hypothetical protein